ncbi:tRNA (adenosine(37)-N6)-threonylcarbamoyltransferase complex transferase subunit TsaD [Cohaesibacter sp. CAU 1516]|uniref:tRNA (adenosine(37)-N6)-threonylcarbamoyltransferase complex transferase subunit TsaD n=1 Tax=Cohaesibacter sp. CAU 1516 TaxID=2576038 RepID=UPI0010FE3B74|nr:tRNA (adenosine(37)-N6)-threonylcarbamoyltransferase complex transferase subunit TsaD [Cohaesibacter sp. CAU 1516]TLP47045.1 tRNA (adenosine(37)-N6)-threonylcarbamoyltransferase complex transferase subunit TsaD [Cohaesibacter sp. CAU 1516]
MIVLGIETSCDETAAAVVRRFEDKPGTTANPSRQDNRSGQGEILSNVVLSQIEDHAIYGGVVPEIAARAHVESLDGIIRKALADADLTFADLDGVAATSGPGLIGGVLIGLMSAKAIAAAHNLPLIAVNHLEGHALTARLTNNAPFPHLLLLVSGGHSQILLVKGVGEYERWGTTIDDALGEAFDKTAKLLGLPYPGGPEVEKAAKLGDPKRFALPRSMKGREGYDFSFSGLKSAVRREAEKIAPLSDQDVADLCASFQAAICDILKDRIGKALTTFRDRFPDSAKPQLIVAGGVAANQAIRSILDAVLSQQQAELVAPPISLCTDNGAMIAWAGAERLALGLTDPLDCPARPRWPLDNKAAAKIGKGRKGAKA